MNIAYILNSTNESNGATKSFLNMLTMLMQKGIHPIVIVPDRQGIYQRLEAMGAEVKVLTFRMHTYPDVKTVKDALLFIPRLAGRLLANRASGKMLTAYLKDKHVDLIHSNVSVVNIGYRAACKLKLPHIFHVREYVDIDFHLHYIPWQHCLRQMLHSPKTYTIPITKDVQKHHQLSGDQSSRVIYNGIKPHMTAMPLAQKEDYFLFAGRIEPAKGLRELVESYAAYSQAVDQPLPLLIAGRINNRPYYEQLTDYIRAHHLDAHVQFLGERADAESLLQHARAIIVPSLFEGFGRCMAEAMFNGCLVIGHNTGGTKEQLDNGLALEGDAIALSYLHPQELTDHLTAVTLHPDAYQPLIQRAFHAVNTLYTSETNANEIYDYYQHILHATHH